MQVADEPLIDRLKELGMDFVADVLEGKVRPTSQQADVLARGYSDGVRKEEGAVVIGGCADGRRVQIPEGRPWVMVPALPSRRSSLHDYDQYRVALIETGEGPVRVLVVQGMSNAEAMSKLLRWYGRSLGLETVLSSSTADR